MASRIYDISLSCGCMISLDGGGGAITCEGDSMFDYPGNDDPPKKEAKEKHEAAWKEYLSSPRYKEHQEEIQLRNS